MSTDLTIDVLGSSSAGNAILLTAGEHRLLLDAGLGWQALERALDFRTSDLDGCLLTHQHQDHARSVPQLLRHGVTVAALRETHEALGTAELLRLDLHVGRSTVIGDHWKYIAFRVEHDVPTVGFLVAHGPNRVLYLTDAGFVRERFAGLTHILVEANHDPKLQAAAVARGSLPKAAAERTRRAHMSIDRTIEMLLSNDLTRAREIHLLHLSDGNSDARAFRDKVEAATGVPTFIAGHQGNLHDA